MLYKCINKVFFPVEIGFGYMWMKSYKISCNYMQFVHLVLLQHHNIHDTVNTYVMASYL